jgi:hypothetical protein
MRTVGYASVGVPLPFFSFVLTFVIASEAKQSSAAMQKRQPPRPAHRPRWIASSLRSSQ